MKEENQHTRLIIVSQFHGFSTFRFPKHTTCVPHVTHELVKVTFNFKYAPIEELELVYC